MPPPSRGPAICCAGRASAAPSRARPAPSSSRSACVSPPSTASQLRYAVALLDLDRAVVDAGEHLAGVAGDDDVDHRRAVALGIAGGDGAGEGVGVLDPHAAATHPVCDHGVINLYELARLLPRAAPPLLPPLY